MSGNVPIYGLTDTVLFVRILNIISNLAYHLCLPGGSVFKEAGSFADFRRAVNVTTSDFGRLEHPLQRLFISTIMCF